MAEPVKPFTINTPFNNYFFYKLGPKIGQVLAGGTLEFFYGNDHATHADTYSNIDDEDNPTVNPNPFTLGVDGSTAAGPYPSPQIYLQDIVYFLVVRSQEGIIQFTATIRGASLNDGGGGGDDGNNPLANLLPNGQFTYPIVFWQTDEEEGQISEYSTVVALGWNFISDVDATQESNFVTINDVSNELIEGTPINEIQLTSFGVAGETEKDFVAKYGHVAAFENQQLTFSVQLQNKALSTVPVSLLVEKNYGDGGSDSQLITLTTFTVSTVRDKFTFTFQVPPDAGVTIGPGNYAAIHLQGPLGQNCSFGFTNALLQFGEVIVPIYVSENYSLERSQAIGAATQIENLGLEQNYSPMTYSDGEFFPNAQTGAIVASAPALQFSDKIEITTGGQELLISGYSEKKIPYSRLYDLWGNVYGGSGDLIVTADNNVVTFRSPRGSRQRSAYTNGDIGAGYVVANTVIGLRNGFDVTYVPASLTAVIVTWLDNFAIRQIPGVATQSVPGLVAPGAIGNFFDAFTSSPAFPKSWGTQSISVATITPGSISTQPSASISFDDPHIANYQSYAEEYNFAAFPGAANATANILEFASFTTNTVRGPYATFTTIPFSAVCIRFSVNGVIGPFPVITPVGTELTITFDMQVGQSLAQNVARFIAQLANPFQWTITINSAPLASQYFLYSAGPSNTGTEYYGWYKVNGAGVDPAIAGRTGVEIDILSSDSIQTIATKTALATDSATFKLPDPATDLPAMPPTSSYYVYL